jgi:Bacterial protein of unknown function (DUF885)
MIRKDGGRDMMRRHFAWQIASLVLTLGITGCQTAVPPPAVTGSLQWAAFVKAYAAEDVRRDPARGLALGLHSLDGRLPDWSEAGLQARADFYARSIAQADAIDAGTLTRSQRIERVELTALAKGALFWLTEAEAPKTNIRWYFENGLDPSVYVTRDYADAPTRMRAFTAYAEKIPEALEQMKARLTVPMPQAHRDYAVARFSGLADYFGREVKLAFSGVGDSAAQDRLSQATTRASAAMRGAAAWAASQHPLGNETFALGKDKYAAMLLATEGIETPVDELYKVAMVDLTRNQTALAEVCTVFAPKTTPAGCVMQMRASKPRGGAVVVVRALLPELLQFVRTHDLVSLPDAPSPRVEDALPYTREARADLETSGPFEPLLSPVLRLPVADPAWPPEEQLPAIPGVKELVFTAIGSVWPGRYGGALFAHQSPSLLTQAASGTAMAEGWGLYAEEMMWDSGYGAGDAEAHVGQLISALRADCRLVTAIGLQTQGMTQEQAKQLFTTECYQDEANARLEAARGTYDPTGGNGALGKLMIIKLRDDWTKGDHARWKAFHDQLLSLNSLSLPLARAAMMGGDVKAVF